MKQKLFTLLTLLLTVCSGAWADYTYSSPLTETFTDGAYGNYTFLDVANTTSNATITEGSVKCLTYGAYYAWLTINKNATNKWMTREGGDNAESNNHGYANPAAVGFIATDALTSSDNGYGRLKMSSSRTTCFYVTGCTGVAILGQDNKTSDNKWITLKVEEIALDGTATQSGTTKEQKSTSVYLLPSDATMTADKYYRITITTGNSSGNCYLYQIRFTQGTSSTYGITWANGGHGIAPTEPTSSALLTLPTMDTDGGYVNTGWTADVAVKLNGTSQAAGTVLAVGSKVRLTAATTLTGVWKSPSTFALTSAAEVELTVGGGTSQIAYENAVGTVTYESANTSVATVDEDGKITAVAGGKTTITVSDPGNASTAAGSATVTVLVPYGNPAAATSYALNQDTYAFSNTANTKYYFTNGFTIDVTGGGAEFQNGGLAKSKKYSHARTYTINVPGNVTVTYSVITARNNYANENSNPASNWGTVFGTNYSSEGNLPWSTETPAEKDFVIASPSAGGTLAFQPGGNQWQAIIDLYTDTYRPKHTVSYVAGDGTGTMADVEVREGSAFTLPIQGSIAAPSGKYFTGWNDGAKDYAPGDSYTMSTTDLTFTAQWATSESANHYHYSYKDATRYNGTTYTDPTGAAATSDGSTHTLTDGNLCSSLGGITSVAISGAKYDGKTGDLLYMNSYLKVEKGGTAKVTITIADGYAGTLRIKAGGYSSNPTLAISNSAVKVSGTVGGVATTENNYNTLVYTLYPGANEITCTSQNMYITEMDIVTTQTVSGTISASGWNTFSSNYKLDLSTITGGSAYYASAAEGSTVTLTTTDAKVDAGEGLMIKGTSGETFTIGVTNADATFSGTNKLVGLPNGGTVEKNNHNYVFGWATATPESPGFYLINDTEPVLGAGKAYLHADADLSARLSIDFEEGETTGVASVGKPQTTTDREFYNLAGQRVAQPTKGLYIVNGRKVVIK